MSQFEEVLTRRGPDTSGEVDVKLSDNWRGKFVGFTLWLQGNVVAKQPLVDQCGNVLLWNGDVFSARERPDDDGESDTEFLLGRLQSANTAGEVTSVMNSVNGPWSFVYYKESLKTIFTGRDRFGRHSLLWNCVGNQCPQDLFILSSAVPSGQFSEVPASALYRLDLSSVIQVEPVAERISYETDDRVPTDGDLTTWVALADNSLQSSQQIFRQYRDMHYRVLDEFEETLRESVRIRTHCQPMLCWDCTAEKLKQGQDVSCGHSKLAVLFSGGLDSAVLAAMADSIWPEEETIDLLNVAFKSKNKTAAHSNVKKLPTQENAPPFSVPDRLTGLQALQELQKINPKRKWNFIQVRGD